MKVVKCRDKIKLILSVENKRELKEASGESEKLAKLGDIMQELFNYDCYCYNYECYCKRLNDYITGSYIVDYNTGKAFKVASYTSVISCLLYAFERTNYRQICLYANDKYTSDDFNEYEEG